MVRNAPKPIRILSYNVNFLPSLAGRGKADERRAEALAEALAQQAEPFDVLCLQEVFTDAARRILGEALKHLFPHQVRRGCSPKTLRTSSGLFLASRLPFASEPQFEEFSEFAWLSSDALSTKGVLGVQLDTRGTKHSSSNESSSAFVFNTHLQSSNTWKRQRLGQLKQIRQFMNKLLTRSASEHSSAVLCGDLNVEAETNTADGLKPTREYSEMIDALGAPKDTFREHAPNDEGYTWHGAENAMIPSFPSSAGHPCRLDYVLAFDNVPDESGGRLRDVVSHEVRVEKFGDCRKTRLSDHFAVCASLFVLSEVLSELRRG